MAKIKYETYIEQRNALVNAKIDQARQYDKYILTLASGTFGFSVVFMRYIAPTPDASTLRLIIIALAFFSASIFSTLLSFLMSQKAIAKQFEITDLWYKSETDLNDKQIENKYAVCTTRLNWISMALFTVGGVLLIFFIVLNLSPSGV